MRKLTRLSVILLFSIAFSGDSFAQDPPSDHRPVISPDGKTIVFMSTREGGDWELFRIDADSSGLTRLTKSRGWDGYAVFAPDGKSFVFDRDTGSGSIPHRYDLQTGAISSFLGDEAAAGGKASVSGWSLDGSRVVMFIERDEKRDLYFADANGENLERITDTHDQNEHDAHFSPDGTKLAFAVKSADGSALNIMDLETGVITRHVSSTQYLYGLDWSPDGAKIAYTDTPNDNPDDNAELYILDMASGTVERLTRDEHYDHMPVWLPGGKRIMFTSYRSGREEIYILDLASGGVEAFDTGLE